MRISGDTDTGPDISLIPNHNNLFVFYVDMHACSPKLAFSAALAKTIK